MMTCSADGIKYLCDKCLAPTAKADKPTYIGREEVWEYCKDCKEAARVKSITPDQ
jgi:hypothetical protein